MNAGDVWKYEQTANRNARYSKRELERNNLYMNPISLGNQTEILIQEKILIYGNAMKYGSLPSGNKIFK